MAQPLVGSWPTRSTWRCDSRGFDRSSRGAERRQVSSPRMSRTWHRFSQRWHEAQVRTATVGSRAERSSSAGSDGRLTQGDDPVCTPSRYWPHLCHDSAATRRTGHPLPEPQAQDHHQERRRRFPRAGGAAPFGTFVQDLPIRPVSAVHRRSRAPSGDERGIRGIAGSASTPTAFRNRRPAWKAPNGATRAGCAYGRKARSYCPCGSGPGVESGPRGATGGASLTNWRGSDPPSEAGPSRSSRAGHAETDGFASAPGCWPGSLQRSR